MNDLPVAHEQRGFILWFTGMSGAGKSTLSRRLAEQFIRDGRRVEVLDGDEVRSFLSAGLSYTKEDRDTNVRRIGFVARLLARNGVVAITAAISPFADTRQEVRAAAERDGIPFVEVHVHCALETLASRDVKGLYKAALAGEIPHFTGVTDPYEPPVSPDVRVDSGSDTIEQSLEKIAGMLLAGKLIE